MQELKPQTPWDEVVYKEDLERLVVALFKALNTCSESLSATILAEIINIASNQLVPTLQEAKTKIKPEFRKTLTEIEGYIQYLDQLARLSARKAKELRDASGGRSRGGRSHGARSRDGRSESPKAEQSGKSSVRKRSPLRQGGSGTPTSTAGS